MKKILLLAAIAVSFGCSPKVVKTYGAFEEIDTTATQFSIAAELTVDGSTTNQQFLYPAYITQRGPAIDYLGVWVALASDSGVSIDEDIANDGNGFHIHHTGTVSADGSGDVSMTWNSIDNSHSGVYHYTITAQ